MKGRLSVFLIFYYFYFYALQVGAALNFDVLKFDEDSLTALLRVFSRWARGWRETARDWDEVVFNVFCFIQGFSEAVELPDPAGVLPEPGLRLQSPAGQQTHMNVFFKGIYFI